jgi:hypothetical protein
MASLLNYSDPEREKGLSNSYDLFNRLKPIGYCMYHLL